MAQQTICDRCTKTIEEQGFFVIVTSAPNSSFMDDSFDLCDKCTEAVVDFIRREADTVETNLPKGKR